MKKAWVLLMSLFIGAVLGVILHPYADQVWIQNIGQYVLNPIGQIFLRLIFMVVVPLLFSALVLGVIELGQAHDLGKVVAKTLMYTVIASSFSVLIGIGLVNTFKPGVGLQINPQWITDNKNQVDKIQANADQAKSFDKVLIELFPKNPVDVAARALDGEVLAFMVFSLLFGFALVRVTRNQTSTKSILVTFIEELLQVCMKMVEHAMKLAPLAVFSLVFMSAFKFGLEIFQALLFYVVLVIFGLLLQQFVVYAGLLKLLTKKNPFEFFKNCREVYLYAFSTASSNATLPYTLSTAEEKLKLPKRISRFVLTVGSTANQNGTALFEGVTVLFLAQVTGVDLTLGQQVFVVVFSIIAGIGTAGVPGGSLPPMMILLKTVGIPVESIGLIIGVDRLLDMARTTLNVSGDLVVAALVSEGEENTK
jgi:DAACS family dicarboxylate/amino acid:cation (Na+ or H+) symporter